MVADITAGGIDVVPDFPEAAGGYLRTPHSGFCPEKRKLGRCATTIELSTLVV